MDNLEKFDAVIGALYSASADGTRWGSALSAIEDFTDSSGAVLHVLPIFGGHPTTKLGSRADAHFPAEELAKWERDYISICPRFQARERWPDRPHVCDWMILGEFEMDRDPTYDWYAQHGVRYFIGSRLPPSERHAFAWSLQRSKKQGHAQADDLRKFELIKRHLAQALAIGAELQTLDNDRRFHDAVLDAFPQAIFTLDGCGRLITANARAAALLAEQDSVCLIDHHVAPLDSHSGKMFSALLRGVLSGGPGGTLRLDRRSGKLPCAVRISPIVVSDEQGLEDVRALVIVSEPGLAGEIDDLALRRLYELTPSEARTAVALCRGHSIQSAAHELGVSAETTRSHLKSIFRKVGVSRQQDLVRILTEAEVSAVASSPATSPE